MDMPIDIQHQQMGYDRTATMFSPEGHLLQVEYAEKAVRLGPLSIGMVCSDGVFILADKRIKDKLIVHTSSSKIHEVDSHIITSVAGIVSDARVLIEKAQVLSQQNRLTYDSAIETELVTKEISDIKQQFSQYGGARPFGVALMIAGVNNKKAELFISDVTGNYLSYHANAIGENDEKAKEILREKYKQSMTIKEGVKLALEIFNELKEDFKLNNLELAYITKDDTKIKRAEGEEIKKL
ncbi:MAG: archaeal proteasome endopeptidase complex subunit alpha [Candidatus Pacearchaeota archaeon]|nr:archaeal proteasome endopeptidase complex subunit alpha [Candidatus Pacearchaeota archaeon]